MSAALRADTVNWCRRAWPTAHAAPTEVNLKTQHSVTPSANTTRAHTQRLLTVIWATVGQTRAGIRKRYIRVILTEVMHSKPCPIFETVKTGHNRNGQDMVKRTRGPCPFSIHKISPARDEYVLSSDSVRRRERTRIVQRSVHAPSFVVAGQRTPTCTERLGPPAAAGGPGLAR